MPHWYLYLIIYLFVRVFPLYRGELLLISPNTGGLIRIRVLREKESNSFTHFTLEGNSSRTNQCSGSSRDSEPLGRPEVFQGFGSLRQFGVSLPNSSQQSLDFIFIYLFWFIRRQRSKKRKLQAIQEQLLHNIHVSRVHLTLYEDDKKHVYYQPLTLFWLESPHNDYLGIKTQF